MGDPDVDARAIAVFESRVKDYVDLHRRLERAWPPTWLVGDFEQAELASETLRTALREARPLGAQGQFFTPDVAQLFRHRIASALRHGTDDTLAILAAAEDEDTGETGSRPVVNERAGVGGFDATWALFDVVPLLPIELDYRIVGRDLVLLDVHANMVVDVLDLAVPVFVPPTVAEPARPDEEARPEDDGAAAWADEFVGCLSDEIY
jgi:hypothetical protein